MAKIKAKKRARNATPTKNRENFRTQVWEEAFLRTLKNTGSPSIAAKAAGIAPSTAYRRKDKVAAFHEAWMATLGESVEEVNAVARGMVMNGTVEDVWHGGKIVGKRVVRYPYLIVKWLEAHDPARWRNNYDIAAQLGNLAPGTTAE